MNIKDVLLLCVVCIYGGLPSRLPIPHSRSSGLDSGVTFVRWGRKTCPAGAELVYTGQVGGNFYSHNGGGSNNLCLPLDPQNGHVQPYDNNQLFGAEYNIYPNEKPWGWSDNLVFTEVPCAVCVRRRRSLLLMIPGLPVGQDVACNGFMSRRRSCYNGWSVEYHGNLMSDHVTHRTRDFACVDRYAVPLDNRTSNFYPIRTQCGSLRCPPYKDRTDVLCVVCTK